MYQVLYRKWRPTNFSDVIAQPQVTETLKNELRSGRIAHAYLFTGSKGTGKTSCAKILAKAVNCLSDEASKPCCKCENCKGIQDSSILDVVEIDAASNNGVDNIRELREEAYFTPTVAKYRVYIIDEVHMLSVGAFNALLKILEEPPKHVVFILATTEVHKLPATILSRCQRFEFRRIAVKAMAERLLFIANEENIYLDEKAALLIAKLSDGAMRDALSLLDQCMSKSHNINLDLVCETAGNVRKEYLSLFVKNIANKDSSACIKLINELYNNSKSMPLLCEELISYLRDMMLVKTMQNAADMLFCSDEELSELKENSLLFGLNAIVHALSKFQEALQNINKGSNAKIQMELLFVSLCEGTGNNADNTEILGRIEALERQIKAISTSNSVISSTSKEYKNTTTVKQVQESKLNNKEDCEIDKLDEKVEKPNVSHETSLDTKEIKNNHNANSQMKKLDNWKEILKILARTKRSLATALSSSCAYIDKNIIYISSDKASVFTLLKQAGMKEALQLASKEITGQSYIFKKYEEKSTQTYSEDVPTHDELDDFLNSLQEYPDIDIEIN